MSSDAFFRWGITEPLLRWYQAGHSLWPVFFFSRGIFVILMNEMDAIKPSRPPAGEMGLESSPKSVASDNPLVRKLLEPGAVNFANMAKSLDPETLDEQTRQALADAFAEKVRQTLFGGHFNDLCGAQGMAERLGVSLEPPPEFYDTIQRWLPRLDEGALTQLGLSQPAVVGEYNLEGARKVLRHSGFSEEELTDNAVREVLDYRHILMVLKERQRNARALRSAMPRLLTSGEFAG